jgi:D-psicose/D-tagatose/L-ribulose 3-epimerase
MRIALCNEVLRDMAFAEQCAYTAALGYDGLEVAPFTLGDEPHFLPARERKQLRAEAEAAGVAVTGLHWLLVTPKGLSITSPDHGVRERTTDVLRRLVDLCADLGGRVLVHGSPAQRTVAEGDDPEAAWERAREVFAAVAPVAEAAGVTYCLEPLARRETNFVNTVAEAARMVEEVGSPAVRTMIDTSAAGATEGKPVAELIREWLPTGLVAHVQVNDTNRRGPGQGADRFSPVLAALREADYRGVVAVEPFDYRPDGRGSAARAIGYLRGILEALDR